MLFSINAYGVEIKGTGLTMSSITNTLGDIYLAKTNAIEVAGAEGLLISTNSTGEGAYISTAVPFDLDITGDLTVTNITAITAYNGDTNKFPDIDWSSLGGGGGSSSGFDPYDAIVPDDYPDPFTAYNDGKNRVYCKAGTYYYTNVAANFRVNAEMRIHGNGKNKTFIKIFQNKNSWSMPQISYSTYLMRGSCKYIDFKDLTLSITNINSSTSAQDTHYQLFGFDATTFKTAITVENCAINSYNSPMHYNHSLMYFTSSALDYDIKFINCDLMLNNIKNNQGGTWLFSEPAIAAVGSSVLIDNCRYVNKQFTYRDLYIRAHRFMIRDSTFVLADGKADANSLSISSILGCENFYFLNSSIICGGTVNYSCLLYLNAANNYIDNSTIISHNTVNPTKADIYFNQCTNVFIRNCVLQGKKGFYDTQAATRSKTNIVTGCKIDYSGALINAPQALEFHNNVIDNIYEQ